MIIGFQGEDGAFSDAVAKRLYPTHCTKGFATFDTLMLAVSDGRVDLGVLPCENSLHGSISRVYDLLLHYEDLCIIDETSESIVQSFVVIPGSSFESVTVVTSHPVALEQCRDFLALHPQLVLRASYDTAGAIRELMINNDTSTAAIGPAAAAQLYGAEVLIENVNDAEANITRFFIIAKRPSIVEGKPLRACIALNLAHRAGSLHEALGVLANHTINIRSLVARPNREQTFEYTFYFEFESTTGFALEEILSHMPGHSQILGYY